MIKKKYFCKLEMFVKSVMVVKWVTLCEFLAAEWVKTPNLKVRDLSFSRRRLCGILSEYKSILGCYSVSSGKCFLTFRSIVLPSSSGSGSLFVDYLILRSSETLGNYWPVDMLQQHVRLELQQNRCKNPKTLRILYFGLWCRVVWCNVTNIWMDISHCSV